MKASRTATLPSAPGLSGFVGLRAAAAGLPDNGAWIAVGLSAAAHVAAAGWVATAGFLSHEPAADPPRGAQVTLVSAAAFDAMRSTAPTPVVSGPTAPPLLDDAETLARVESEPDSAPLRQPPAGLAILTEDAPEVAADPPSPPVRQTQPEPRATSQDRARLEDDPPAAFSEPKEPADPVPAAKQDATTKAEAKVAAAVQPSATAQRSLMADWGGRIRKRIDRAKSYPRAERAAGVTGTVTLRLAVSPDGRILKLSVASSSGSARLDEAAIAAVRKAGRMPKAPSGLGDPTYSFNLPVAFTR